MHRGYTFTEGYDVNNGFHPPKVEVDEYDQCTSLYTTSVTNNEGKAAFYCTG